MFHLNRLPFSLCSSPATWQRFIDEVITGGLTEFCFRYLDDFVIITENFDKHLKILNILISKILVASLSINRSKCEGFRPEIKYSGYVVDRNGLRADPDKISAIVNIPRSTLFKKLRSLLEMVSWYRRFIPNFAQDKSRL